MPGEETLRQHLFPSETPVWHGKVPFVFAGSMASAMWERIPVCHGPLVPLEPMLTAEEERMLAAFRKFKAMLAQPEGEFRWKTQQQPGVIPAPERFLIVDPKEDTGEVFHQAKQR